MNAFPSALELLQFALDYRIYFVRLVIFILVIWAFFRGAAPEKAIAAVIVVTLIASRLYRDWSGVGFELTGVDQWALFIDSLTAVSLVAIALHANRIYPLWMAGLQLICVLAHLARAIAPDIDLLAYAIMVIAPSNIQLLVFALGIRAHRKRVAKYGKYRSWRGSWPRLLGRKLGS